MTSPLEGALAAQIYAGMRNLFLDATYTVDVPNTGSDPADPPAPTPTDYPCKSMVEKYSDYYTKNGLVQDGDRKVLILANSLSVQPVANARLTIRGITFTLTKIETDPAQAVWECTGRM